MPRRVLAMVALALCTVATGATRGGAAEAPLPQNTLTLEPLAIVFTRTISIEYERVLADLVSVFVAPAFTVDAVTTADTDVSFFAVGAAVGPRIFPFAEAPQGLFVSAFFEVAYTEAQEAGQTHTGVGYAAGGMVGYTWILGEVVDVSAGTGAAWYAMTVDVDGQERGVDGVFPLVRLALGVAF